MSDNEDKKIIQEVLNGNTMAFGELIKRYQSQVYSLSLRMTGITEDAEDITQNVFLKVYSKLSNYNPEFRFFSWIYKTAINESINHINARKYSRLNDNIDFINEDIAENRIIKDQRNEQIRRSIFRLKPKYRVVIVLKYFEELSYDDICTITGLPVKTIKSRLFEARNILRKSLSDFNLS